MGGLYWNRATLLVYIHFLNGRPNSNGVSLHQFHDRISCILAYSSISPDFPWDAGKINAVGANRTRTSQTHEKDLEVPSNLATTWCSVWEHRQRRDRTSYLYCTADIWIGLLTNYQYSTAVRIDWYLYARGS